MKIENPKGPTPQTIKAKGSHYTRATRWGLVAQAWPKKRGAAVQGYDLFRQGEFAIAGAWAANPMPLDRLGAIEIAKDSSLVWRDILVRASMGTLMTFVLEDGTTFTGARVTQPNATYILDLISNTPGAMLVRDQVGWVAIPPPTGGQFLTADGQNQIGWTTFANQVDTLTGSFSPVVGTSGVQPTGVTYTTRVAKYVYYTGPKLCWISAFIQMNNKGAGGTGFIKITGLPYAADATANFAQLIPGQLNPVTYNAGGEQVQFWTFPNEAAIQPVTIGNNVGQAQITWANLSNGDVLQFTGFYLTI